MRCGQSGVIFISVRVREGGWGVGKKKNGCYGEYASNGKAGRGGLNDG